MLQEYETKYKDSLSTIEALTKQQADTPGAGADVGTPLSIKAAALSGDAVRPATAVPFSGAHFTTKTI